MPKETAINTLLQDQNEYKKRTNNSLRELEKENKAPNPIRKKPTLPRTKSFLDLREYNNKIQNQSPASKYTNMQQYLEELTEYSIYTSPSRVGQRTINFQGETQPSTELAQASCELAERVRELSINE
jgi:hypothetical protein